MDSLPSKPAPEAESPANAGQNVDTLSGRKHTLPAQDIFSFTSKIHHDTYPAIDPTTNPCTGKAVLVTGSNRGLGLAILLSYARAGASHLAVCSRSPCPSVPPQLREAAVAAGHPEPTVLPLLLDVTDQVQVCAAAKEVEEKWGTVVNMVSIGALYAEGGGEAYSLAKFTLSRLAEFLCHGYKNEGVISYSVHPGGIDTPLARNMPPAFHHLLCDTETLAGDSIAFLTRERRPWLGGRWVNCNWDMPELMAKEGEIVEHDLLKFRCQGLI